MPEGSDDVAVAAAARTAGIEVYPLSTYVQGPPERWSRPGLLLGYAAFEPATIGEGVHRLERVLERVLDGVLDGAREGASATAGSAPKA